MKIQSAPILIIYYDIPSYHVAQDSSALIREAFAAAGVQGGLAGRIHIYIYINTCTDIHIHIHIYIYTCIYIYIDR